MSTKKKYWSVATAFILIAMLLIFDSCLDSKYNFDNFSDEMELTPAVSVPIGYGSLSINNILSKLDSGEFVKQYEDSLLYIFYSDSLFSYDASEVIEIPDQDFLQFQIGPDVPVAFVLPGIGDTISEIQLPPLLGGGTIPLNFNQLLEFSFENNERIDSIVLKSMQVQISVVSTFQNDIILDFNTSGIKIGDESFNERISMQGAPVTFERTLNNVTMYLDTSDHKTTVLSLDIDLKIINEGNAIRPGDNCSIIMSLRDIEFSAVYGYLGEYEILTNAGEFDVSFFSNKILGGTISFANPDLALLINNSFGVPIQIDLDMDVVSNINDPPTNTDIVFIGVNPFDILAPELDDTETQVPSEIRINKVNSNLIDALESSPEFLNYSASARINAGGPSEHYNFVTEDSKINVDAEFTLPIDLRAEGFTFEDTLDFEGQFGEDIDKIDFFRFSVTTENSIPLEVKLQVYFTDSLYTVVDSLFKDDNVFLKPATLGSDGKHTIAEEVTQVVEYNTDQIETIRNAKYIRVNASVNTPQTGGGTDYFKFYSYYKLDFNIGASVRLRINTNEL